MAGDQPVEVQGEHVVDAARQGAHVVGEDEPPAAARRQARIDSRQDVIVGLNRFRADDSGADFEILSVEARDDDFLLTFTRPVDPATAEDLASWSARRFTYRLHNDYGSPETDDWSMEVVDATVTPDARSVRLTVDGRREGYVHELVADGVRSADGEPLLHATAWYTLQRTPRDLGRGEPTKVVIVADDAHGDDAADLQGTLPSEANRDHRQTRAEPGVVAGVVDLSGTPSLPGLPPLPDLLRDASLTVLALDRAAPDADTRALLDRALGSGRSLAVLSSSLQLFADTDATEVDDLREELLGVTSVEASGSTLAADADVPVVVSAAGVARPVLAEHCTVLAAATLPDGGRVPVLWVHEARGRRVVVSSVPGVVALSGTELVERPAADTVVARLFHAAVRWALDLADEPAGD